MRAMTLWCNKMMKKKNVEAARAIFDNMQSRDRDVVSWTTLISAYAKAGRCKEAIALFQRMRMGNHQVKPNKVTFIAILAAATQLSQGKMLHALIVCYGVDSDSALVTALMKMYGQQGCVGCAGALFTTLLEPDMVACTTIMAAYIKNGHLEEARVVFNKGVKDVVTWTAMIQGYAQNGQWGMAFDLLWEMDQKGVQPDKVTFIAVLGSCSTLDQVKKLHNRVSECRFDKDIIVVTTLISMYGRFGESSLARALFDGMPCHDIALWNAMISSYAQNGRFREALSLFQELYFEGIKVNKVTFISILDACVSPADIKQGKVIHATLCRSGIELDAVMNTILLKMYSKCGSPDDVRSMLDNLHKRDTIVWNAMIAAYIRNGKNKRALELFEQMYRDRVKLDMVSFISFLDACASLAAFEQGKMLHASIVSVGFKLEVAVDNALISMYGKCGSLEDARSVFDKAWNRDLVTWNAMIMSYAENGQGRDALDLFKRMILEGVRPDGITFVSVLSACSHAGLLNEGWGCFVSMQRDHGVVLLAEHYACAIDLLGRVGRLDKAEELIHDMPIGPSLEPHVVAWRCLLGACKIHGDVERGTRLKSIYLNWIQRKGYAERLSSEGELPRKLY